MLATPDKQTLFVFRLPPKRNLVFIKGIHAVLSVDIHIKEGNAVFNQGVPYPHGNSVNVCVHGRSDRHSVFGTGLLHCGGTAEERPSVCQIGKIQISSGNSDISPPNQLKELLLLLF